MDPKIRLIWHSLNPLIKRVQALEKEVADLKAAQNASKATSPSP